MRHRALLLLFLLLTVEIAEALPVPNSPYHPEEYNGFTGKKRAKRQVIVVTCDLPSPFTTPATTVTDPSCEICEVIYSLPTTPAPTTTSTTQIPTTTSKNCEFAECNKCEIIWPPAETTTVPTTTTPEQTTEAPTTTPPTTTTTLAETTTTADQYPVFKKCTTCNAIWPEQESTTSLSTTTQQGSTEGKSTTPESTTSKPTTEPSTPTTTQQEGPTTRAPESTSVADSFTTTTQEEKPTTKEPSTAGHTTTEKAPEATTTDKPEDPSLGSSTTLKQPTTPNDPKTTSQKFSPTTTTAARNPPEPSTASDEKAGGDVTIPPTTTTNQVDGADETTSTKTSPPGNTTITAGKTISTATQKPDDNGNSSTTQSSSDNNQNATTTSTPTTPSTTTPSKTPTQPTSPTTLGTNENCVITSSSLSISSVSSSPSVFLLSEGATVTANLQSTGTCVRLSWPIDGQLEDGGTTIKKDFGEGDHTVYGKKLGCGYVRMVKEVKFTNKCEEVQEQRKGTDSLVLATPRVPLANVEYKWECQKQQTANCYTGNVKYLSMKGTINLTPISDYLDGSGDYMLTANATDPATGQWSCIRYQINIPEEPTTKTPVTTTTQKADDGKSGNDGTTPGARTTTPLGYNKDCVISSSTLNISSLSSSPSEILLSEGATVTADLQSTGTCVRLHWAIDGQREDGGTTITKDLGEGDHTICCYNGDQKLGCGYVRMVKEVKFTNMCKEVEEKKKGTDSLVLVTPRVPSDNVEYKWECQKQQAVNCYTGNEKYISMKGSVTLNSILKFLDGSGDYTMTANVTDPVTGQWSCIRYKIGIQEESTTTTTAATTTKTPQGNDGTGNKTDTTANTPGKTTTLGTNNDCVISSSSMSISSFSSTPSEFLLSEGATVSVDLQSTGSCVRLKWSIDDQMEDGGTAVTKMLTEGDHKFCYFNGNEKLGCGFVRIVKESHFTNKCEEVKEAVKGEESVVLVTPRVPTDNVNYKWECKKTEGGECFTPTGKFLPMKSASVTMTPVNKFLDGPGDYTMTANVTDPLTGQWSCRRYQLHLEGVTATTRVTTTTTSADRSGKSKTTTKANSGSEGGKLTTTTTTVPGKGSNGTGSDNGNGGSGSSSGDRKTTSRGGNNSQLGKTTQKPKPQVTMSPESQKKVDEISKILEKVQNPQEIKEMCSKNNSELATAYGDLTTNSNQTKEELVAMLKNSNGCVNEKMADVLNEALKELASLPIECPESLIKILDELQTALDSSKGGSMGSDNAERALEGEFPVLYGTVETNDCNLISTRSTVRIAGKLAYISGDIRPTWLQSGFSTFTHEGNLSKVTGEFGGRALYSSPLAESETRNLNRQQVFSRMNGDLITIDSGYDQYPKHLIVWNATLDRLGDDDQILRKGAVTAWMNLEGATIRADGSRLRNMVGVPADSLTVNVKTRESTVKVLYGEGVLQLLEIREKACILMYDQAAPSGDIPPALLLELQTPVVIENVECALLESSTRTAETILRPANAPHSMALATVFPRIYIPPIMPVYEPVSATTLPFGEAGSVDQMLLRVDTGVPIQITGQVTVKGQTTTLTTPATVQYTGRDFNFIYGSDNKRLYLKDVKWTIESVDGKTCLVIKSALYQNPTEPHTRTEVEVSSTATIYLSGGQILRNGSHGYLISDAVINHTGVLPPGAIDLNAQSLLNQEAQNLVMGILKGTAGFLKANSSQMTDQQLNDTASKLLNMAGSVIDTMINSLNNPLNSDLDKNLALEKANYDDIFNVLPEDAGDIRYVEEYTEEEWAKEATKLAQENIARKMAKQLKETMGALGDALAERYIDDAPYLVEMTSGGASLVEAGGNASVLFSQEYMCDDWLTRFPPKLSDLNIATLTERDTFRVSMYCYKQNPYAYSANYKPLITSGAVDITLKTADAKEIRVMDSPKPVMIRGKSDDMMGYGTMATPGPYHEIQILDIRTFRSSGWNFSVEIEIQPENIQKMAPGASGHVYVSFQGIPGPLPWNHDFHFELAKTNSINNFFMDSSRLQNASGLFYMGVGIRMPEARNDTVNYTIDGEMWYMLRAMSFDYRVRVLTKGCYAFNEPSDRFSSERISSLEILNDQHVQCAFHHLTMFSVGIFDPDIPVDFSYEYVEDVKAMNVHPMLCTLYIAIFFMTVLFVDYMSDQKDLDRGMLRHMVDNRRADKYMYVVVVETGHHMFSTSDSKFRMNFTGTEGEAVGRQLTSFEDKELGNPLSWGRVARFLMTTRWPLGDLQFLRLWMEKAGNEHRESWFCSRVVVKDVQTNKRYYFPVENWLGSNAGDGSTERLAEAVPEDKSLKEACKWTLLCETISYICMFTGGGGTSRHRVERFTQSMSLCWSIFLALTIQSVLVFYQEFDYVVGNILGYKFEYCDLLLAFLTAVMVSVFSCLMPHLISSVMSKEDELTVKYYQKRFHGYKVPSADKKHVVEVLLVTFQQTVLLLCFIACAVIGTKLENDNAEAFMRRIVIAFVLWVIFIEPLKGVLLAQWIVKHRPDHNIISPIETSWLDVQPMDKFPRFDPRLRDTTVGTTYADLDQLQKTKDSRMKEEKLFHTMREVILLVGALFVFTGLAFASRDTGGYYYQMQLRSTLNVDPPSKLSVPFDRVLSFMETEKAEDWWRWAELSLTKALRASWYDGKAAHGMRGFINDKVSRAMGNGVIRQIRAAPKKATKLADKWKVDAYDIDATTPEKTSFGTGWNITNETMPEYTYRTGADLMNTAVQGEFFKYQGGGYTINLAGTAKDMTAQMRRLRTEGWIDNMTRAVIVEFSLYNAQVNYFAVVQLMLEIPKQRVYHPSVWIESFRLFKYQGPMGNVIWVFECMYLIYALLMFVKEICYYLWTRKRLILSGRLSWNPLTLIPNLLVGDLNFWISIDLAVGVLSGMSIIAFILRSIHDTEALEMFTANNGNAYINLSLQRDIELAFNVCFGGVVFFITCKMIRILRFNRRISILADTLDASAEDTKWFGIGFFIICCAFNAALFMLMNGKMEQYRTAVATFQTTVAAMLGKYIIRDIYEIDILGATFFMMYMLLGTIVLLNVYVMIIMTAFEEVRNDPARQANEYELLDHLKTKAKRELGIYERVDCPPAILPDKDRENPIVKRYMAKMYLTFQNALRTREELVIVGNNPARVARRPLIRRPVPK